MKYIYGLGRSGQSIINYLDLINEKYFCWDDNNEVRKYLSISIKIPNIKMHKVNKL